MKNELIIDIQLVNSFNSCGQLDDYRTILEEYEALVYFCESIE